MRLSRQPVRKPSPPGAHSAVRQEDDSLAIGLGDNIETIRTALAGVQELSVRFFRT